MPTRRDGLKPGEVARAKRVARALVNALGPERRAITTVRCVVARLKRNKMRPRDFDSPNGEDAIAAIIATMSRAEMRGAVGPLGKIWELISSRAIQYLGKDAYR
jgi:hypothetical protein